MGPAQYPTRQQFPPQQQVDSHPTPSPTSCPHLISSQFISHPVSWRDTTLVTSFVFQSPLQYGQFPPGQQPQQFQPQVEGNPRED